MSTSAIILLVVVVIPLFIYSIWRVQNKKPMGLTAAAIVVLLIAVAYLQHLLQK